MLGLDAALLRRQQNDFTEALKSNAELQSTYTGLQDAAAKARETEKGEFNAETQAIRDYLVSKTKGLSEAQAKQLEEMRTKRTTTVSKAEASAQEARDATIQAEKERTIRLINSELTAKGIPAAERARFLADYEKRMGGVDAGKFYSGASAADLDQWAAWDDSEVAQFNRINDLLGIGDRAQKGVVGGINQGGFDAKGYSAAVDASLADLLGGIRGWKPPDNDLSDNTGGAVTGEPSFTPNVKSTPLGGPDVNDLVDVTKAVKKAGQDFDPTNSNGWVGTAEGQLADIVRNPVAKAQNAGNSVIDTAQKVIEKVPLLGGSANTVIDFAQDKANQLLNSEAGRIATTVANPVAVTEAVVKNVIQEIAPKAGTPQMGATQSTSNLSGGAGSSINAGNGLNISQARDGNGNLIADQAPKM
jgi:hypothetical protein